VAVWTGTEMIVWGGGALPNPDLLDHTAADGAAYDPAADTWRAIRSAPGPLAGAAVGWTGKEMLVWGGHDSNGYTNTGYRYDVAADSWQTLTTVDAPSPRAGAGAVWTGTGFLVWGGVAGDFPPDFPSKGAIWFPDADAGDGG
jgi:N-acetylneuraminic acid mutarotase